MIVLVNCLNLYFVIAFSFIPNFVFLIFKLFSLDLGLKTVRFRTPNPGSNSGKKNYYYHNKEVKLRFREFNNLSHRALLDSNSNL